MPKQALILNSMLELLPCANTTRQTINSSAYLESMNIQERALQLYGLQLAEEGITNAVKIALTCVELYPELVWKKDETALVIIEQSNIDPRRTRGLEQLLKDGSRFFWSVIPHENGKDFILYINLNPNKPWSSENQALPLGDFTFYRDSVAA
jgi:hypothetical protein